MGAIKTKYAGLSLVTEDGRIVKNCPMCYGTGKITFITPGGYTKTVKDPRCKGTGIILKIA